MKIAVEDLLRGNAVSVCMDEEIAFDQLDDREGGGMEPAFGRRLPKGCRECMA